MRYLVITITACLLLVFCSYGGYDARRAPEGWTFDLAQQCEIPCLVTNNEKKNYAILQSEYLEEGDEGTTEGTLVHGDNLAAIMYIISPHSLSVQPEGAPDS